MLVFATITEKITLLHQKTVNVASANQNGCGDHFTCYGANAIVVVTIHVVVTTEIVITKIWFADGISTIKKMLRQQSHFLRDKICIHNKQNVL